MARVVIYTTRFCPYCVAAKRVLTAKGVGYEEIAVDASTALRYEMQQLSGRTSVPQIFIGERHIGGFTDLVGMDRAGELDELLSQA